MSSAVAWPVRCTNYLLIIADFTEIVSTKKFWNNNHHYEVHLIYAMLWAIYGLTVQWRHWLQSYGTTLIWNAPSKCLFLSRVSLLVHAEHDIVLQVLSVCLSVCLSNAGAITKRINITAHIMSAVWSKSLMWSNVLVTALQFSTFRCFQVNTSALQ